MVPGQGSREARLQGAGRYSPPRRVAAQWSVCEMRAAWCASRFGWLCETGSDGVRAGPRRGGFARAARFACLSALALFAAAAHAQVQSVPGRSRSEVLRLPPVLQAAATDFGAVRCSAGGLAGRLEGETALAQAADIAIEGVQAIDAAAVRAELGALTGAPVSREGLARAAARLECRYREAGFLFARAVIEAVPGVEGRYVVRAEEGVVGALEVLTADAGLAKAALRAFSGVRQGEPLNANDVRRGLAIAGQIGLTDVRPTVRRSRTDLSKIDLILVTAAPNNEAFLQTANTGSDQVGPWTVFVGGRTSGLLGGAERLTIGLVSSTDGQEQRGAQAQVETLLSGNGLIGRLEAAVAEARPGGDVAVLEVAAKTRFLAAEAVYPVAVRRGLIVQARAGLEAVDQDTDFLGGLTLSSDRLRIIYAGIRTEAALRGGLWRGDVEVRQGLSGLGASRPQTPVLSRPDADPQARVIRAEAEVRHMLGKGFVARAAVRAQWTDAGLAAFEEFNHGSVNGGFGLDPGAVSGDSGVTVAIDIDGPALAAGPVRSVRPLARVTASQAWTDGPSLERDPRAAAVALGALIEVTETARLELLLAEPIKGLTRVAPGLSGSRLYARLSTSTVWARGGWPARLGRTAR
jgi:hemolysin activation/secretion protein